MAERHGYMSEARFFYFANVADRPKPRGLLRVERASAIADVRGIDGYVYHSRGATVAAPKRIPFQLKSGIESNEHYHETHCGLRIPIVGVHPRINHYVVFERLRCLLDTHERLRRTYDEPQLRRLDTNPPTENERRVMQMIERSRLTYVYPAPAFA